MLPMTLIYEVLRSYIEHTLKTVCFVVVDVIQMSFKCHLLYCFVLLRSQSVWKLLSDASFRLVSKPRVALFIVQRKSLVFTSI